MEFGAHFVGHRLRHRSLANTRRPEEQERARVGIRHELGQDALRFRESDEVCDLARTILFAETHGKRESRGAHRAPPLIGSVCEMWKTVVVQGRRISFGSPVSWSVSLLHVSIMVTTLMPCSPRRTTRPSAFHASKVNTFSRGLISGSGIPFAANPWKIAGKFVSDWPCTARLSDSS